MKRRQVCDIVWTEAKLISVEAGKWVPVGVSAEVALSHNEPSTAISGRRQRRGP